MQQIAKEEPLIMEAIRQEGLFRGDPEMILKYIQHEMDRIDYEEKLKAAEIKGKAEGKTEAARNMLLDGMSIELAAKYSGLSEEDIKGLV